MSRGSRAGTLTPAIGALFLILHSAAGAEWAAQPGERVRNAFGPSRGERPRLCRGACGLGCPDTCSEALAYECLDASLLRRVVTYECGTHPGCRDHDDCVDRCTQASAQGDDCSAQCHSEAIGAYGLESALSWAAGGGPYDPEPILFEYTRGGPESPEPAFRCPEGARLECAGGTGRCLAGGGGTVAPVFDSYPSRGPDSMRISGFLSGRVCTSAGTPSEVCEPAVDVQVTGNDLCEREGRQERCTWYGFELDYENADPSMPLTCESGRGGSGLFAALVGATGAPPGQSAQIEAALGQLEGMLASGSFGDMLSGMGMEGAAPPEAAQGMPDVAAIQQALGGGPSPVPASIRLDGPSGHLFVPMYEVVGTATSQPIVREVRCSHKGEPVLEATYRLHSGERTDDRFTREPR